MRSARRLRYEKRAWQTPAVTLGQLSESDLKKVRDSEDPERGLRDVLSNRSNKTGAGDTNS